MNIDLTIYVIPVSAKNPQLFNRVIILATRKLFIVNKKTKTKTKRSIRVVLYIFSCTITNLLREYRI